MQEKRVIYENSTTVNQQVKHSTKKCQDCIRKTLLKNQDSKVCLAGRRIKYGINNCQFYVKDNR